MANPVTCHITANAVRQPCGCADWDQWNDHTHAWEHQTFHCSHHTRLGASLDNHPPE